MRVASACLLGLAAVLLLRSGESVRADDLVHITAKINYDVRTEEGDVLVTWDISFANNDPNFIVFALPVPVLSGATEVTASSAAGAPLSTRAEPTETGLIDLQFVSFDRNVFFGDVYDFTLSYVLSETRQSGLIVTPFHVFLPLVAVGDEATVTVTTPVGLPWSARLEPDECELLGAGLTCSGSENIYFAGRLEVSQLDATKLNTFNIRLDVGSVAVNIEYFESEDATATHQREVIEATLPLIAEAYGLPDPGVATINVVHSGRQSVLGYGGLTDCTGDVCKILISPGAGDYTLVHELAHLWSGLFAVPWLVEGFADWVATQVIDRAPAGLLTEDLTPRIPAQVSLQLDEWRYDRSLIGASDEEAETVYAGYDYSLRFVRMLADEVGAMTLQDINRTLAAGGGRADSRRYMDVLEEVSGINPDSLFLLWVFPESSRALIEERREARDRYAEVAARLAAVDLSEEPLEPAWEAILRWRFAEAQSEVDAVEANIARALDLEDELRRLEGDADSLGLAVPESIGAAISAWDLETADDLIESARRALAAYGIARERLAEPRNLWERFGLLGVDMDGELAKAREAFEDGRFERTLDRSAAAVDIADDASQEAMLRLLVVAGVFAAFAGAIAVAYWVARLRRRRLAGR